MVKSGQVKRIILLLSIVLALSSFSVSATNFATDLALYYNFSQTSGNILDSSPSGVNANDYEINSRTATGILGNGYDFEATGRDDYILLPYNAILNRYANDHFTYNIWIKPESFDESFFFPGRCNYATDWRREICWGYTQSTNVLFSHVCFADDSGAGGQCTDNSQNTYASPMTLNEWQMMTFSYNGSALNVYRNGMLVNSRSYSGNIFDDTNVDAVTTFSKMHSSEQFAGTANFDGIADELGFWKRGMQQPEIQNLYNTYLAGCDPVANPNGCSIVVNGSKTWTTGSDFIGQYFNITYSNITLGDQFNLTAYQPNVVSGLNSKARAIYNFTGSGTVMDDIKGAYDGTTDATWITVSGNEMTKRLNITGGTGSTEMFIPVGVLTADSSTFTWMWCLDQTAYTSGYTHGGNQWGQDVGLLGGPTGTAWGTGSGYSYTSTSLSPSNITDMDDVCYFLSQDSSNVNQLCIIEKSTGTEYCSSRPTQNLLTGTITKWGIGGAYNTLGDGIYEPDDSVFMKLGAVQIFNNELNASERALTTEYTDWFTSTPVYKQGIFRDTTGWVPPTGHKFGNLTIVAQVPGTSQLKIRYANSVVGLDSAEWTNLTNGTNQIQLTLATNDAIYYEFKFLKNSPSPIIEEFTLTEFEDTLSNVYVSKENAFGKVSYPNTFNMNSYPNYLDSITISENFIDVDVATVPLLNTSANLTFYNTGYSGTYEFNILKNGQLCTTCANITVLNGNVSFVVTSFSNFSLENATIYTDYDPTTYIMARNHAPGVVLDVDTKSLYFSTPVVFKNVSATYRSTVPLDYCVMMANVTLSNGTQIMLPCQDGECRFLTSFGTDIWNQTIEDVVEVSIISTIGSFNTPNGQCEIKNIYVSWWYETNVSDAYQTEFTGPKTTSLIGQNGNAMNLTLENTYGLIKWNSLIDLYPTIDETTTTQFSRLDNFIEIAQNSVVVDSGSTLNTGADITFYNTGFTNETQFIVLKDGSECLTCTVGSVLGDNITVSTTSFSNISLLNYTTPILTVVYPNGGEVFDISNIININWTITNNMYPITTQVFYSEDNGTTWTLTTQLLDTTLLNPSTNYLIRVNGTDGYTVVSDESDSVFSIIQPTMTIIHDMSNQQLTSSPLIINYNATILSASPDLKIANCSLYVNGGLNQTDQDVNLSINQQFSLTLPMTRYEQMQTYIYCENYLINDTSSTYGYEIYTNITNPKLFDDFTRPDNQDPEPNSPSGITWIDQPINEPIPYNNELGVTITGNRLRINQQNGQDNGYTTVVGVFENESTFRTYQDGNITFLYSNEWDGGASSHRWAVYMTFGKDLELAPTINPGGWDSWQPFNNEKNSTPSQPFFFLDFSGFPGYDNTVFIRDCTGTHTVTIPDWGGYGQDGLGEGPTNEITVSFNTPTNQYKVWFAGNYLGEYTQCDAGAGVDTTLGMPNEIDSFAFTWGPNSLPSTVPPSYWYNYFENVSVNLNPNIHIETDMVNNTINYNEPNLTINFNFTKYDTLPAVDCDLLVNEVINQSLTGLNENTNYQFVMNFSNTTSQDFNFKISCDNGEASSSTLNYLYRVDTIVPAIISNYDQYNGQKFEYDQGTGASVNDLINITTYYFDNNLYAINETVICDGNIIHNFFEENVNYTNITNEVLLYARDIGASSCQILLQNWDSHTNPDPVKPIQWYFQDDNLIAEGDIVWEGNFKKLTGQGQPATYFYLSPDGSKYKLKMTFNQQALTHTINISSPSGNLNFRPDDGYLGHFVYFPTERWIDHEGTNIANVQVTEIGVNKWNMVITHFTQTDEVEFESIGDLNTKIQTYSLDIVEIPTKPIISNPNGGEVLLKDDGTETITWTASTLSNVSTGVIYNLSYTSNGIDWTALPNQVNTTSYVWDISSVTKSDTYKVRVRALDASNNTRVTSYDESNNSFIITESITQPDFITPQQGDVILSSPKIVYWNKSTGGLYGITYNLSYSTDNATWTPLISETSQDITYMTGGYTTVALFHGLSNSLDSYELSFKPTENAWFKGLKAVIGSPYVASGSRVQLKQGGTVIATSQYCTASSYYATCLFNSPQVVQNGLTYVILIINDPTYNMRFRSGGLFQANPWSISVGDAQGEVDIYGWAGAPKVGYYSWNISGLSDNLYYLDIVGQDGLLSSQDSTVGSFRINLDAPTTPTVTYPNGGEMLQGQVAPGIYNITWNASVSEIPITYHIYYSNNSGSTWTHLDNVAGGTEIYAWNISNMATYPAGDNYRVKVIANDSYFTSQDTSNADFEIIQNLPPVITGVVILNTTAYTTTNLEGECNATDDGIINPLFYTYEWYKNGNWISGQTTNKLSSSYTTKGDIITMKCMVFDGLELVTDNSSVTILNTIPTVPQILSPLNNSVFGYQTMLINYTSSDADNDVITYEVYLDTNPNPITLVQNSTSSTYLFNYSDGDYYLKVRAYDGQAYSGYSGVITFRKNTEPPSIVLNSPLSDATILKKTPYRTLDLQFDYTVYGVENYNISYCQLFVKGVLFDTNTSITTGVVQHMYANLQESPTYRWFVRCEDQFGNVGNSEERYFILNLEVPSSDVGGGTTGEKNQLIPVVPEPVKKEVENVQNEVNKVRSQFAQKIIDIIDKFSEAWSKVPFFGGIEFKQAFLAVFIVFLVWQFIYRTPVRRKIT